MRVVPSIPVFCRYCRLLFCPFHLVLNTSCTLQRPGSHESYGSAMTADSVPISPMPPLRPPPPSAPLGRYEPPRDDYRGTHTSLSLFSSISR